MRDPGFFNIRFRHVWSRRRDHHSPCYPALVEGSGTVSRPVKSCSVSDGCGDRPQTSLVCKPALMISQSQYITCCQEELGWSRTTGEGNEFAEGDVNDDRPQSPRPWRERTGVVVMGVDGCYPPNRGCLRATITANMNSNPVNRRSW